MRNLPTPARDAVRQHLIDALKPYVHKGVAKGFPVSAAQLDEIIDLYDQYDAAAGEPSAPLEGHALAPALRDELHAGYRFVRNGMRLSDVRVLLTRGIEECPVCGVSYPSEMDHYLPRSVYKPLAVYIRNLVPLCHPCNHRKNDYVGNNPAQRFLHPYLEPLPNTQFLNAQVDLAGGGLVVDFVIEQVAGLTPQLHQRLVNQFEKLNLNERYGREVNEYMMSQTTGLHDAYSSGDAQKVQSYLSRQGAVEAKRLHINHWKPVLLNALAGHGDFCDGGFAVVLPTPQ